MTTEKRAKLLLFATPLFLALALGGALFYYYHIQGKAENVAVTGIIDSPPGAIGTADAPVPQPEASLPVLPDLLPPERDGNAPGTDAGTLSEPEEEIFVEEILLETPVAEAQEQLGMIPWFPGAPESEQTLALLPENGNAIRNGGNVLGSAETPEEQNASVVVLYGKGRPVTPDGFVVRGDIPAGQDQASARVAPTGQDSIVSAALVQDLAAFLAANYWPAGTHPAARGRGISTAGVQWLNYRYGGQLRGLAVPRDNPAAARERVLNYVFVSSMLRALHNLYSERFFTALQAEALAQRRGPEESPLTLAQMAEMFGIYSGMAGSLAEAVRAYAGTPPIRPLVAAHAQASAETEAAFAAYTASREQGTAAAISSAAQAYQEALRKREQAKDALVAAMRRGSARSELDAESLVYTAKWLYRRGENTTATLSALAEVLDAYALRLSVLRQEYAGLPMASGEVMRR